MTKDNDHEGCGDCLHCTLTRTFNDWIEQNTKGKTVQPEQLISVIGNFAAEAIAPLGMGQLNAHIGAAAWLNGMIIGSVLAQHGTMFTDEGDVIPEQAHGRAH